VPIVRDQMHHDLPYLFMAGYAEVPKQPVSRSDGGRTFEIDVKGKKLRIDLVRQSYTRVVYEGDDDLIQAGEYLKHDSWNGRATLERAEPLPVDNTQRSTVDLAPILFQHGAYTDLQLKRLHLVALGREWKIDRIHEREGPER
jgi:hypothetical protein